MVSPPSTAVFPPRCSSNRCSTPKKVGRRGVDRSLRRRIIDQRLFALQSGHRGGVDDAGALLHSLQRRLRHIEIAEEIGAERSRYISPPCRSPFASSALQRRAQLLSATSRRSL